MENYSTWTSIQDREQLTQLFMSNDLAIDCGPVSFIYPYAFFGSSNSPATKWHQVFRCTVDNVCIYDEHLHIKMNVANLHSELKRFLGAYYKIELKFKKLDGQPVCVFSFEWL